MLEARDNHTTDTPPLARELTGHLACVRCGYDLRGLSVLGQCSECGLRVRTTLLAKIDPMADELQPIAMPYATAVGLLLWAASALGAALIIWALRARDVAAIFSGVEPAMSWAPRAAAGLVLVTGFSALALVRPHRLHDRRRALAALGAVLLHAPLAWLVQAMLTMDRPMFAKPYLEADGLSPLRVGYALAALVCAAAIAFGLRANLQVLVSRSVLMRTGREERQAIPGVLAAIGLAAAGQAVHLVALMIDPDLASIPRLIGTFLVAVGSMLITLGLVGLLVDSVRLWPVITSAPLGLRDVLGTPAEGPRP